MRGSLVVASAALLGSLVACNAEQQPSPPPPRLGGPSQAPSAAPKEPMDRLETAVTQRLNTRLGDDGLRLQHVECPHWDGTVPRRLQCEGYVDGVVGEVGVELTSGEDGRIEFDAELAAGVVATTRLVDRLDHEGYADVRCGKDAAYPAEPGLRIVCRARRGGETVHVVATVTDHQGAVKIEDY